MHCWFDFEDGHTCMLDDGHAGPHEPTADTEIVLSFNAVSGGLDVRTDTQRQVEGTQGGT